MKNTMDTTRIDAMAKDVYGNIVEVVDAENEW